MEDSIGVLFADIRYTILDFFFPSQEFLFVFIWIYFHEYLVQLETPYNISTVLRNDTPLKSQDTITPQPGKAVLCDFVEVSFGEFIVMI